MELHVNGELVRAEVEARVSLADFLRDTLGLRGTRLGCEHGVCGSCTVLVDDLPVRSCLIFAIQADGTCVRTVESLSPDGVLHPLQDAFHRSGALQCGYCTAGMLMTALAMFERHEVASPQEVREAISGNLCRCTGYSAVVEAIVRVVGDDVAR